MNRVSDEAQKVRAALLAKGIETPLQKKERAISPHEQKELITYHMREILHVLGLDLQDDSLFETPERVARMYVDEIFCGLDYSTFPKITLIANKMDCVQPVTVNAISFTSFCEHHFVSIDGHCCVAYVPKAHLIGLSKINRVVRFFAKRPQVQERLTQQIMVALQTLLDIEDVAVFVNATHHCVKARGVMDLSSFTTSYALGGQFNHDVNLRREFLQNAAKLP
ncbi:MAG: GTP cyclohydrolase I FolE [Vibrionaceae bacterium]